MPIIDHSPITSRSVYPMRRAGDIVVPAGDALIAVDPVPHHPLPPSSGARPDPTFMAHLIAMAEQDPQTRLLRRAAVSDVQAAYRTSVPSPNGQRSNRTA